MAIHCYLLNKRTKKKLQMFLWRTNTKCKIWPLEVSHQVTEGLIVGRGELQQTLVDSLQSGFSIWQFCIASGVRLVSEHRRSARNTVLKWNNPEWGSSYLQLEWIWSTSQTWWQEWEGLASTASKHRRWCWCRHRHWHWCQPYRHLLVRREETFKCNVVISVNNVKFWRIMI